jgi:DNA repair protein RadC
MLSRNGTEAASWDATTATTTEILAKLLGPATGRVCENLTGAYSDLRDLATAHPADLHAIGFSSAAIERLTAVVEFAKRFGEQEFVPGTAFRGSADIYAHFRERLASEPVEYFYAVLLDTKHRKLRDVLVSKGSLSSSIVHPRDVYAQVIRHSAAAVIFVHNHPSGCPEPSKEDIEITRRLREVGDLVGVRVLDHIVIGRGKYISFIDDGYW